MFEKTATNISFNLRGNIRKEELAPYQSCGNMQLVDLSVQYCDSHTSAEKQALRLERLVATCEVIWPYL